MKYDIGYKFISNEGYEYEVIEVLKKSKRRIRTTKEPYHEFVSGFFQMDKNQARNPFHKNVWNRGFLGIGKYNSVNSKINGKDLYDTWNKMFDRCYRGSDLTYKNVDVCEEWYSFQNFMKFVDETFPKHITTEQFILEKDIMQQGVENKIYSPETCLWIPKRINSYIQNKRSGTKNEFKGINKDGNQWVASSTLFENGGVKYAIGYFYSIEEAISAYKEFKLIQDEKAKDYLRSLNYLPEEIIQLIKTV